MQRSFHFAPAPVTLTKACLTYCSTLSITIADDFSGGSGADEQDDYYTDGDVGRAIDSARRYFSRARAVGAGLADSLTLSDCSVIATGSSVM